MAEVRGVTVVDYGIGNLLSVARALEHAGARVALSGNAAEIERAARVVLPGVGAFGRAMEVLRAQGLDEAVIRFAQTGRPLLGICLGMQILFDESEEFGRHAGLGLVPGRVVAIPNTDGDGKPVKLPHVGWCPVRPPAGRDWTGTILDRVPQETAFYFVHWYEAAPARTDDLVGETEYRRLTIPAVVQHGGIAGTQFHPEKSGPAGLRLLGRFLAL
jgi:glutamine amidotransferase